jgi:hypothetical protein
MLILELLLLILYGIGFCLFIYNCEITNKYGAVGAVLLIISAVLQLLIRFI